eukprot:5549891-Pyramimonas_sp.AAC.1
MLKSPQWRSDLCPPLALVPVSLDGSPLVLRELIVVDAHEGSSTDVAMVDLETRARPGTSAVEKHRAIRDSGDVMWELWRASQTWLANI